jgi:iron complex transport system ATP-binding protein
MVEVSDISYGVGQVRILEGVTARFRQNAFNVILGPNGAGKSTLLKVATRLLDPTTGIVRYDDQPLTDFSDEELARKRAVLSQQVDLAFSLPVKDVVLMGRYPHYGQTPSARDLEIVAEAIQLVGLSEKKNQAYPTLSGGERQKTQLARVLAQIWQTESSGDQRYLFLDEPTSGLDVHYQLHTLDIARSLLDHDCTIIAVMHDLNVAAQYADAFYFLNGGKLVHVAEGRSDISSDLIEQVFRVKARQVADAQANQSFWRFSLE